MLYNIALQVCPTYTKAEKILLLTFKKVYHQKIDWMDKKPFCFDIIKLIIQTAQEELYPGDTTCNFKIKEFENTPLLHKLLVEQLTLENYCIENSIARRKALLTIRNEFLQIRLTYPEKYLYSGISSIQHN